MALQKPLKRMGITAVILIGGLTAVAGLLLVGSRSRLEGRLSAIRAAGDPVTLSDIASDSVPPESNAFAYLNQTFKDVEAIDDQLPDFLEPEFLSAQQAQAIVDAFAKHPHLIANLQRAAQCEVYVYPPQAGPTFDTANEDSLEQAHCIRKLARVLFRHCRLMQYEGRANDAIEDCQTMLRLSRTIARSQFLTGYLGALTMRQVAIEEAGNIVRSETANKDAENELVTELSRYDAVGTFRQALKRERVLGLMEAPTFKSRFALVDRTSMANRYLDLVDGQLQAETYLEARAAIPNRQRTMEVLFSPTDVLAPEYIGTRAMMEMERAKSRCLLLLVALKRFTQENPGEEPTLADLGLPSEKTTDPFNGEPLKLKRVDGDWLIYSVGEDLIDDGGDLNSNKDVGLEPIKPATKAPSE